MTAIDECLAQAMAIPGAQGVTLVDYANGFPVAALGADDLSDAAVDAAGTADLIRAVLASPSLASAWTGDDIEEITVSGTAGYHLLVLVGTTLDTRLCLHLRLDRNRGNLALARHQLRAVVRGLATV